MKSTLFEGMLKVYVKQTVPTVNADSLAKIGSNHNYVFLDSRDLVEYNISHLPNAIRVGYDDFAPERINQPKNTPILVYCTVGYRSEKIGEKLQALGYTNVKNLYGGIVAYKNAGGIVIDNDDMETQKVHCYSKSWSVWLDKGVRVY